MTTTTAQKPERSDRAFYVVNTIFSVAALSFLAWLLLIRKGTVVCGVTQKRGSEKTL